MDIRYDGVENDESMARRQNYFVRVGQVLLITGSLVGVGVAGKVIKDYRAMQHEASYLENGARNSEAGLERQF